MNVAADLRSTAPSGQPFVAARVYAMSIAKSERAGAYAGCALELTKSEKESRR